MECTNRRQIGAQNIQLPVIYDDNAGALSTDEQTNNGDNGDVQASVGGRDYVTFTNAKDRRLEERAEGQLYYSPVPQEVEQAEEPTEEQAEEQAEEEEQEEGLEMGAVGGAEMEGEEKY